MRIKETALFVFFLLILAAAQLQGKRRHSVPKKAHSPQIATVNLSLLIPLHPFYPRIAELNRKISEWKAVRSKPARALFASSRSLQWQKDWSQGVRPFEPSFSSAKSLEEQAREIHPAPLLADYRQFPVFLQTLRKKYRQAFREKSQRIEKVLTEEQTTTKEAIGKAVEAYGEELFSFRKRKIAAQKALFFRALQRQIQYRTVAAEEEFLEFEKNLLENDQPRKLNFQLKLALANPREKEAIHQEYQRFEESETAAEQEKSRQLQTALQAYKTKQLTEISRAIGSLSTTLERQDQAKAQEHGDELGKAASEALKEQGKNFQRLLADGQIRGLENSEAGDMSSLQKLARQEERELQASSEESRRQMEEALRSRIQRLVADSQAYQRITQVISQGNQALASEVIQGLEEEREKVSLAIRDEILKRAEILAKAKGVPLLPPRAVLNIHALDFTPEIAGELRKQAL